MINPPIYRLTTAVSDIDQTNINRYIRDGNWLSKKLMSGKENEMVNNAPNKVIH